ncbi:MAG: hypothetical protein IJ658_11655 [Kiritimatiellae bacterium]|nr:hypothetical protein [Kiritimatiellia bacterium]
MLSNTGPKRRGSPIPVILVLLVLGAGGYFGWKAFESRQAAKRAKEAEYQRWLAERERLRNLPEPETNVVKKAEVAEVKPEPPPEPPKKTEAEVLREEEALRKAVWAQIDDARKKSEAQPMGGFAGIRFGEPIESGAPVRWGTALEDAAGDSVSSRGVAFAVYGPKLKKPFMSLGASPLVWVTPKTRRPYRIEFSRALAPKGDTKHDPETTNLVAILQTKFKSEPFAPRPSVPGRAGCEYVFPMGVTTVIVGEYGDRLKFSVEREDIREETKAETEALRQEKSVVAEDGAIIDSRRYPNGGIDRKKYRGVRLKDETPRAFCGIVFASAPPESARLVVPQKGPKGFFLDYGMAKCRPFRGFAYGRADIDPVRGGVYAVHLTSEGGTEGQDDKDYYESVKLSLSEHYKVTPSEKRGESPFAELTYQIGDLTVTFGPDPRGGFFLRAENQVLSAMAK